MGLNSIYTYLQNKKNRKQICQEDIYEIGYFCILFNGWIYFRTWEVSKISNRCQFTHWFWKYVSTKKEQLPFTLYVRLAEMLWDVLLFWARLHFPFIFGMECSTDDWCFPLSLGHLFIEVEYEKKIKYLVKYSNPDRICK